jgi:hypothetical protein
VRARSRGTLGSAERCAFPGASTHLGRADPGLPRALGRRGCRQSRPMATWKPQPWKRASARTTGQAPHIHPVGSAAIAHVQRCTAAQQQADRAESSGLVRHGAQNHARAGALRRMAHTVHARAREGSRCCRMMPTCALRLWKAQEASNSSGIHRERPSTAICPLSAPFLPPCMRILVMHYSAFPYY